MTSVNEDRPKTIKTFVFGDNTMGLFSKWSYKKICRQICEFPELIEANEEAIRYAYTDSNISIVERDGLLRMIAACKKFQLSHHQKEQAHEILQAYMGFFECWTKASQSNVVVKPKYISSGDFTGKLRETYEVCESMILSPPLYGAFLANERVQHYGIKLQDRKMYLFPTYPKINNAAKVLTKQTHVVHVSTLMLEERDTKKKVDLLKEMKKRGIFGNPDPQRPTYLMLPGVFVVTRGTYWGSLKLTLTLDTDVLMKKRAIFVDPESVRILERNPPIGDMIGNSYITFGGIPCEAIIDYKIESPDAREFLNILNKF
jgi:hypothetical protein